MNAENLIQIAAYQSEIRRYEAMMESCTRNQVGNWQEAVKTLSSRIADLKGEIRNLQPQTTERIEETRYYRNLGRETLNS